MIRARLLAPAAAGFLLVAAPAASAATSSSMPPPHHACAKAAEAAKPPADMVGSYVPQCDANGDYLPLQSHGSTGYSWCVDPVTGVKDESTMTPPTEPAPNCR